MFLVNARERERERERETDRQTEREKERERENGGGGGVWGLHLEHFSQRLNFDACTPNI